MIQNLVTGADGFVGQHLVTELLRRDEGVVGAVKGEPRLTTLSATAAKRVRWASFDLDDRTSLRKLVDEHRVDRIFHLAGLSSAARSFADPVSPLRVNALGTVRLLGELCALRDDGGYDPRVLIPGSGEAYGAAALRHRPLDEECPLEPMSPYAVSKVAQEMVALQHHRSVGLSVIVTRSFNHTGPGQNPPFVAAEKAAEVAEIRRAGGEGVIGVADPTIRRDFTDVRDVVRAYVLLMERGQPGEVYNVCSGRSVAIGELVELMADVAAVKVRIEARPERRRRADVPEMLGSHRKLSEATGWQPQIDLRRSLSDLVAQRVVD